MKLPKMYFSYNMYKENIYYLQFYFLRWVFHSVFLKRPPQYCSSTKLIWSMILFLITASRLENINYHAKVNDNNVLYNVASLVQIRTFICYSVQIRKIHNYSLILTILDENEWFQITIDSYR